MGQTSSAGEKRQRVLFRSIKIISKRQGLLITFGQLVEFLDTAEQCCPWLLKEGTIDTEKWEIVGKQLSDYYYQEYRPGAFLVSTFSIWNILKIFLQKSEEVFLATEVIKVEASCSTTKEEEVAEILTKNRN